MVGADGLELRGALIEQHLLALLATIGFQHDDFDALCCARHNGLQRVFACSMIFWTAWRVVGSSS
jgi:hypothetical protein